MVCTSREKLFFQKAGMFWGHLKQPLKSEIIPTNTSFMFKQNPRILASEPQKVRVLIKRGWWWTKIASQRVCTSKINGQSWVGIGLELTISKIVSLTTITISPLFLVVTNPLPSSPIQQIVVSMRVLKPLLARSRKLVAQNLSSPDAYQGSCCVKLFNGID